MAEFIDKLALLYLKDGKLLCSMSYGKDTWYIPGGKREAGESDLQALKREIKEELDVDSMTRRLSHTACSKRRRTVNPKVSSCV